MYSSRWFMHLGVKSGTTGRRWWNRRGIYANKALFYIVLCVSCRHFLLCEWCHAFKSFLSCQNFFWWVICLFVLWKKMLTFFFKDVHIQILFFKLLMIYNDILLAHNKVLLLFLSVTLYTSILCSYLPLYVKGLCPAYKGLNPCKITKIISMHQLDWGDAHVLFIRAIDNFL